METLTPVGTVFFCEIGATLIGGDSRRTFPGATKKSAVVSLCSLGLVVRTQRCGLREALLAGLDGLKGSFHRLRAHFPALVALLELPDGT
jgi:hypothetical protein